MSSSAACWAIGSVTVSPSREYRRSAVLVTSTDTRSVSASAIVVCSASPATVSAASTTSRLPTTTCDVVAEAWGPGATTAAPPRQPGTADEARPVLGHHRDRRNDVEGAVDDRPIERRHRYWQRSRSGPSDWPQYTIVGAPVEMSTTTSVRPPAWSSDKRTYDDMAPSERLLTLAVEPIGATSQPLSAPRLSPAMKCFWSAK